MPLNKTNPLTLFYTSPYTVRKETFEEALTGPSMSFAEFKQLVKSGHIITHLFQYSEVHLMASDMRLMAKPFVLLCLTKLLSRGKAYVHDKTTVQKITGKLLVSLFIKFVRDCFTKNRLMYNIRKEVDSLSHIDKQVLDLSNPPVYLRTDLCFGLQAGGSVGHIAGVLNHLSVFTEPPIFLTSDRIPTVSAAWETHVIAPGEHFWDFSELPAFDYNHIFVREALKKLGDRTPSFIYQRYSHNNYSGMKLAKHYQVPFVLEFNGSEIWIARNWGNPLKYETVSEHIETANLAAAQLIVVVSQPLKDDLVRKGIAEDKILVNPNGVDPDRYSPDIDGSELRKTWQIEHKTVIGFIGTFGRWHGAEILAEAYGKLLQTYPEYRDKVRLLMIGEGTTLPQVKQTLQKWNVVNSCILTGAIPQTEGPAYLAACDLLVSPQVPNRDGTPFFGSPTKLFEYMAMGKGIVASDLDQIGEILEHNESALLTKPGDAGGLMLALKTLIDDPQMRDRLGRAARKKVIDHYSWKEHTRKIVSRLREKFSH